MDNSIQTLINQVNLLIDELRLFRGNLVHHVVVEPRDRLEDAVRNGFPEDKYNHYLYEYLMPNETAVGFVLDHIDGKLVPYLEKVLSHLQKAVNEGVGGSAHKAYYSSESSGEQNLAMAGTVGDFDLAFRTHELMKRAEAQERNCKELEKALGIKKGPKMSISEADKQNANPHLMEKFIEDPNGNLVIPITGVRYRKNPDFIADKEDYYEQYNVNCATCATAYALRLRGFNVKAKGTVKGSGSLNEEISNAKEYSNVWKNLDGTKAEPVHTDDWMKENGIKEMSTGDYKKYFDETCKEEGVYVVMVRWSGGSSGHATILQRDENGVLYYIEPQKYERSRGEDGRRNLDDLLIRYNGTQKLSSNPSHGYGVLRVDDKLFNTEYACLFEV